MNPLELDGRLHRVLAHRGGTIRFGIDSLRNAIAAELVAVEQYERERCVRILDRMRQERSHLGASTALMEAITVIRSEE